MTTWTRDELRKIEAAEELELCQSDPMARCEAR
jgi:hypothetical protein